MANPPIGQADLVLMMFAFLAWWFWIICAIIARRVRYVAWGFWWVGAFWWLAVAVTATYVYNPVAPEGLAVGFLALLVWPILELRRRYSTSE